MKHIGLFEGIGGFSLAARWMGWETVAWCEWNEFGQKVLKHHFPEAEGFGDITKTDFKKYANKIDILTGGFPCQPYSQAGKRKGKADERHLWPEMLRAIKEIQPRWVVGENVYGLVNWSNGLVFHEVQADLETAGYEVFPYVLPAAAINAPHRRDRIWFVAFKNTVRNGWRGFEWKKETEKWRFGNISPRDNERLQTNDAKNRFVADTDSPRVQRQSTNIKTSKKIRQRRQSVKEIRNDGHIRRWQNFPTQPPICGRNDGIPRRLDNISFSKWRNESIKAYGNAIVPQVALQIFKTIEQYENL